LPPEGWRTLKIPAACTAPSRVAALFCSWMASDLAWAPNRTAKESLPVPQVIDCNQVFWRKSVSMSACGRFPCRRRSACKPCAWGAVHAPGSRAQEQEPRRVCPPALPARSDIPSRRGLLMIAIRKTASAGNMSLRPLSSPCCSMLTWPVAVASANRAARPLLEMNRTTGESSVARPWLEGEAFKGTQSADKVGRRSLSPATAVAPGTRMATARRLAPRRRSALGP
jgi:hypothetical protein